MEYDIIDFNLWACKWNIKIRDIGGESSLDSDSENQNIGSAKDKEDWKKEPSADLCFNNHISQQNVTWQHRTEHWER